MRQKLLPIIVASVLAAVVLAATLLAPGPEPRRDRPDDATVSDPWDVNTSLRLDEPAGGAGIPIEEMERGEFTRVEPGQVVRMTWDRATPRGRGVSEVIGPRARVYFEGGGALEITAERGRFVAPDRRPTSGLFRGDVVVTLLDTEAGEAVDFDDDNAVELRVFIDGEARFDLVLNQIETGDRVQLTGPRVEFFGNGLELTYNQRRNRLERLDVERGERLRLKPNPAPTDTADSDPDTADLADPADPTDPDALAKAVDADNTDSTQPTAQPVGDAPDDGSLTADAERPDAEESEPATFYRARFEDDVRIISEADGATLRGAAFELMFAMTGGRVTANDAGAASRPTRRAAPPSRNATSPTLAAEPIAAKRSSVAHWAYKPVNEPGEAPSQQQREAARSLFVPGDDDLTVQWSGRLRVLPIATPEDQQPPSAEPAAGARAAADLADLAGPEDMLMRVEGRPAVVSTDDGRTLAAAEIDYLGSTGRVRATGDAAAPLELTADELGVLRATRLTMRPEENRGEVIGPGTLRRAADTRHATDPNAADDADSTTTATATAVAAAESTATAQGAVDVAWSDRLLLRFSTPGEAAAPRTRRVETGVGTLRSVDMPTALTRAEFLGDVQVRHTRMDLDAQRLTIDFHEPIHADAPNTPRRVVADGDADLRLLAATEADSARVRGGTIAVDLVAAGDGDDDGVDVRPDRLVASSDASIRRAGTTLAAQRIDARFAEALAGGADDGEAGDDASLGGGVRLSDLVAEGEVIVEAIEEDLVMTGHRLTVDPATESAQLFGGGGRSAVARRADGSIVGERLVLDRAAETVRVPGAGTFEALLDERQRDETLNIDWSRAMSFDRRSGLAEFHGDVKALAIGRREVTQLTSEDLSVQLATAERGEDEPASPEPLLDPVGSVETGEDRPAVAAVRRVTARGEALLRARVLATDARGRPLTRLRMAGPLITFENLPDQQREQVQVVGEGSLQIEDYREPRSGAAAGSAVEGVTGRGVSLLLWNRGLTLDAAANDLIALGDVALLHRPVGERAASVIQLDAQRLVADLAETGGLGAWLGDAPPEPEIEAITAQRGVRVVRDDKTILADRMRYDRSADAIRFTADDGRFVRIHREGDATAPRARSVIYHLREDRLQAFDVVGGGGTSR